MRATLYHAKGAVRGTAMRLPLLALSTGSAKRAHDNRHNPDPLRLRRITRAGTVVDGAADLEESGPAVENEVTELQEDPRTQRLQQALTALLTTGPTPRLATEWRAWKGRIAAALDEARDAGMDVPHILAGGVVAAFREPLTTHPRRYREGTDAVGMWIVARMQAPGGRAGFRQ